MRSNNEDAQSQAGFRALQAGNAADARIHFEAVTQEGSPGINTWAGLAMACKQLGDTSTTLIAVNEIL